MPAMLAKPWPKCVGWAGIGQYIELCLLVGNRAQLQLVTDSVFGPVVCHPLSVFGPVVCHPLSVHPYSVFGPIGRRDHGDRPAVLGPRCTVYSRSTFGHTPVGSNAIREHTCGHLPAQSVPAQTPNPNSNPSQSIPPGKIIPNF